MGIFDPPNIEVKVQSMKKELDTQITEEQRNSTLISCHFTCLF